MRGRLAALALAAVLASGCDYLDETFDDVKKEHGVDLRNPADAATAVSGAEASGNDDAANGLKAMKGFRREIHTANGDREYRNGNFLTAVDEYRKALSWTQPSDAGGLISGIGSALGAGPKPDPEYDRQLAFKRAELHADISSAQGRQADVYIGLGRSGDAARARQAAADALYQAAAVIAPYDPGRASYYRSAGDSYRPR